MARFSVYLVLGLVLGAALVNAVAQDPGYLFLTWGDWQVESSVWLALAILLIAVFSLWVLTRLFYSMLKVPRVVSQYFGLRSARGAQRRADKGFTAFFEGRWEVAEKALRKRSTGDEQSVLHPLYVALAASYRGNTEASLQALDEAERQESLPKSLIVMARAQSYLAADAPEQAAMMLNQLSGRDEAAPRVKAMRCELAYQQRAWSPLIACMPDARRSGLIPDLLLNVWEREAWLGAVSEARDAGESLALWKRAPDTLRAENSPLWQAFVNKLVTLAHWDALQKALADRVDHYCEASSLDAVTALPERQAKPLKKSLRRWCDQGADGRCCAVLADILEREGDAQAAGALWEEAYNRDPSGHHALAWASWLRAQGQDERASTLEKEAMAIIRSAS